VIHYYSYSQFTFGSIISVFDVLNNFIRKQVTAKSNDFKSLFGNEKYSKP